MGPRMCIGARFALIEATTALAKIIRTFIIVKPENFKVKSAYYYVFSCNSTFNTLFAGRTKASGQEHFIKSS